jgi:hypothetical protein
MKRERDPTRAQSRLKEGKLKARWGASNSRAVRTESDFPLLLKSEEKRFLNCYFLETWRPFCSFQILRMGVKGNGPRILTMRTLWHSWNSCNCPIVLVFNTVFPVAILLNPSRVDLGHRFILRPVRKGWAGIMASCVAYFGRWRNRGYRARGSIFEGE